MSSLWTPTRTSMSILLLTGDDQPAVTCPQPRKVVLLLRLRGDADQGGVPVPPAVIEVDVELVPGRGLPRHALFTVLLFRKLDV